MKKFLIIPALLAAILTTSCLDSNQADYTYGNTYATVYSAPDQESGVAFINDYGTRFYVDQNDTDVDISKFNVGDRKATEVMAYTSDLSNYEFSVTLVNIYDVVMGSCATVATEEQSEQYADTPITSFNPYANVAEGYLNIYVSVAVDDIDNTTFYLVDNQMDVTEATADGYYNLELRVAGTNDNNNEDDLYTTYVSFEIEALRGVLEDMDGIMLRLNTESDGEIFYQISSSSMLSSN